MAELCLGTVQFGMDYGINNISGQPSEAEVFRILDLAMEHKIEVFDTAAAYGTAEMLLGRYIKSRQLTGESFKVISKFGLSYTDQPRDMEKVIFEKAWESIKRLNMGQLYGYLLHTPECVYNETVLDALRKIKERGLAQHIGISIYQMCEGEAAIESQVFDFIQLPYNIFDQRGEYTGLFEKLKRQNMTVFTRSAFLQGLFMMECNRIPSYLKKAEKYLREFEKLLIEYQLDRVQTLINYPANHPCIDYVVVGVDHADQLQEITDKFNQKLPEDFLKRVAKLFRDVEEYIILPNLWRK